MRLSPIDTALRMTLPAAGAVHRDRRQARRRLRVHRRHRLGVHHVARRHRLRDQLRVHELRQRDDVSADRADPARVGRHQRAAVALGAAAARAPRACDERAALRPGCATCWLADRGRCSCSGRDSIWWFGDVALASPLATLRYTAKLVASESFDDASARYAARVRDRVRAVGRHRPRSSASGSASTGSPATRSSR